MLAIDYLVVVVSESAVWAYSGGGIPSVYSGQIVLLYPNAVETIRTGNNLQIWVQGYVEANLRIGCSFGEKWVSKLLDVLRIVN